MRGRVRGSRGRGNGGTVRPAAGERQREPHHRTTAGASVRADLAAVRAGEVPHEAQAEAGAAHFAGVARAVEALEHVVELAGGNAAAAVAHLDDRLVAGGRERQLDLVLAGAVDA